MKILVSGSSGLVGSQLVAQLENDGHTVVPLKHREGGPREGIATWYPEKDEIHLDNVLPVDAVIHLAGENIAGRWSEKKKKAIRDSRVHATQSLAARLGQLEQRPEVFISASAIGYYGDRGDEIVTEESVSGDGFLAEVTREWEEASEVLKEKGVRVVHLRFGMILSEEGGALGAMLPPFKCGLGGRVGSGDQYWSWIALEDVVRVIQRVLGDARMSGPFNAVSPEPVTNAAFTASLGKVLGRPTLIPVPGAGARLVLGELADSLLLNSARVVPKRLEEAGFEFRHEKLEEALRHELGR